MRPPERVFERRQPSRLSSGAEAPVTVVMALYNYAAGVTDALDSVRAQSHPQLDLIVVDDHSGDGSAEVVRDWMERHSDRFGRTLLLRLDHNRSAAVARNVAFEAAETDAVMVLDADNTLRPPAIARLLEAMQDAGVACAYSQLVRFGVVNYLGVADVWRREGFSQGNYVDAMALVSRAAWAAVGGYSIRPESWEDYDLWCKFVDAGLKGVYVPELLCRYYVRDQSMSHSLSPETRADLIHEMTSRHPWLQLQV